MSISTVQTQTPFARRVSFNNLSPDYIDVDAPPGTHNRNGAGSDIHFKDVNYGGYGGTGTLLKDFSKIYSGGAPDNHTTRKRYHLPDPPSKSILKNKLNPAQAKHNLKSGETSGINYHDDLNEIARSGTSAYDSDDDADEPARQKSYVGMTDEELMALDPQYSNTRSRMSNVDKFRFDSQKTYYLPSSRKASTTVPTKATYPTSNENNYKSINLTVRHMDYDDTPINRTLLTVISGRKHTWNALDWLLLIGNKHEPLFLNDGDYLVVTSFIPAKFIKQNEKKRRTADEILLAKCDNLLNYIINELPLDLRVKITVEFITDLSSDNTPVSTKNKTGNKYMLAHIYKQYQPLLIIIGNKSTNLNFKYPLRMKRHSESKASSIPTGIARASLPSDLKRNSLPPMNSSFRQKAADEYMIKFSSYIIKYSTIPVIVVGNATRFHTPPSNSRKNSNTSMCTSSNESIESEIRFPTDEKLSELDVNLRAEVNNLLKLHTMDKFQRTLAVISDKSLDELNNYLETLKSRELSSNGLKFDDSVIFNSKMHSIYNSQCHNQTKSPNNNNQMYKVKSMISYDEEDERKNEKLRSNKKDKPLHSTASAKSSIKSDNASIGSSDEDKKPKKKSFWKKLGLKKN